MSLSNAFRHSLPQGYAAVPLFPGASPPRVCVVVRQKPDPSAGWLVLLRDMLDAQAHLGCIVDAGGVVHQWVEIWTQNVLGLAQTPASLRESLTNGVMDRRWQQRIRAVQRLDPAALIRTGFEEQRAGPLLLDPASSAASPVSDEKGRALTVCTDDALLQSRGLPAYATTPHRYLHAADAHSETRFFPVSADSPKNESTSPLEGLLGQKPAFNIGGGFVRVCDFSPLDMDGFADVVSGKTAEDLGPGRLVLAEQKVGDAQAEDGWLCLGKGGRMGRLLETLHLKLRMLADAVVAVHGAVREQQTPLLNLSPASFQVRMGEAGSALPSLWTARAALVDGGDALEAPLPGSDARYFLPARQAGASIYRPEALGQTVHGICALRIRQVLPEADGALIVEGTFTTQERLPLQRSDVVWLRVPTGSATVNLYGRMETQTALASGEYRFRTFPQKFSDVAAAQVRSATGVPIASAPFEIIPLLSSPCDLFALGVLAVRLLLVNSRAALPVALDEMLSLARQMATEHDPAVAAGKRIRAIFERDARWMASLGPHRLREEELSPQEAMDAVPPEVWWDVLAAVVRMFPGIGPDSRCADFGDAPAGAIHRVFERAMEDLEKLLLRTRSLIVIDWRTNREIHAVIREHLTGLARPAEGRPVAAHG